ncbi:MAG: AmmeMemoRadiSam system radical SAM enzyme [Candidatus Hydrogenedentes bacterium]|nr:AmmeMemoRadiSam system radical SAM enzyme [Candidatus Hydrogenedentota bacterium]
MRMSPEDILKKYSHPANPALFTKLEGNKIQCHSCGHQCIISEGKSGICKLRFNENGSLFVPYGYVAGLAVDPIEKKPFFHVLPGSTALSYGMLGCNFHCPFCQNWFSSQTLRDPNSSAQIEPISSEEIVNLSIQYRSPVIVSTYNEPLITSDWSYEIFSLAKEHHLLCGYVSNGHASTKVLEFLRPVMDLYKVDLKSFNQQHYDKLGGSLKIVCNTIEKAVELGYWVEIVTLLVPTFNDDPNEISQLTRFIANINTDIPWHVTGFYPQYKMQEVEPTQPSQLETAYKIGKDAGLKYVYVGNRPGKLKNLENTYCPNCSSLLIERTGFNVWKNEIKDGKCPKCGLSIPGIWNKPK